MTAQPNRVHYAWDTTFSAGFGELFDIFHVPTVVGQGHNALMKIVTQGGLSLEITKEFAQQLHAKLGERLAP